MAGVRFFLFCTPWKCDDVLLLNCVSDLEGDERQAVIDALDLWVSDTPHDYVEFYFCAESDLSPGERLYYVKEYDEYLAMFRKQDSQLPFGGAYLDSLFKMSRDYIADIRSQRDERDTAVVGAPQPLTDAERRVFNIIARQPVGTGIMGKRIVATLHAEGYSIGQSTLTKHIVPKLKQSHGVKNRRGVGYYVDSPERA